MTQSSPIFSMQSLAAGFKTDLDKVVRKFSATDCVRYEVFAEVWREMKLNFLCAGRQTEREARELMEIVFEMITALWFPPSPFQTRVCALYMLYGLYCTQPCQPKVKIRLIPLQWAEVMTFIKTLEEQHHLDVLFVLNKLRAMHAFSFVATKNEHFPQSKEGDTEMERSNKDPMKEVEESLIRDTISAELLEHIEALHTQYHKVKCSLAGPGAEQPDRSLNLLNDNIVTNIKNILQRFEGRRKAGYKNAGHSSSGDSSESDPEYKPKTESVGSKRRRIRNRAYEQVATASAKFAHPGPVSASDDSGSPKKGTGKGSGKGRAKGKRKRSSTHMSDEEEHAVVSPATEETPGDHNDSATVLHMPTLVSGDESPSEGSKRTRKSPRGLSEQTKNVGSKQTKSPKLALKGNKAHSEKKQDKARRSLSKIKTASAVVNTKKTTKSK